MKRVNVYKVIREMRETIVKTMQERGITEIATILSPEEWAKHTGNVYEPDEDGYDEGYETYMTDEAPYIIFFDKYNNGIDYRVDKVRLVTYTIAQPRLEFDCVADEIGDDTFSEDDVVFLTLYNVYDKLMDILGLKDDGDHIWVLFAESLFDYQLEGRLIMVFESEAEAREAFAEEVKEDRKTAEEREYEINEDDNFFEAYPDGSWGTSHLTVELKKCKKGDVMWCKN